MVENRKYVRFKAPFCIQYNNEGMKKEVSGVIKDISMGGIRALLDTAYDVYPESIGFFSILLPESALKFRARVVWAKESNDKQEVGAYFLKIHDSDRQEIYNSIFKHFKEEIINKWWQI